MAVLITNDERKDLTVTVTVIVLTDLRLSTAEKGCVHDAVVACTGIYGSCGEHADVDHAEHEGYVHETPGHHPGP